MSPEREPYLALNAGNAKTTTWRSVFPGSVHEIGNPLKALHIGDFLKQTRRQEDARVLSV